MANTTALVNVTELTTHEPITDPTPDPTTQAINAFRIIICTIGILGNIFVFTVILLSKEYKKGSTHWYVLQLAIADTAFLLTLPFQVSEDVHNEWIYPDGMCKAKEGVLYINYYSSVLFLMVMAIDRYLAICHGFSEILSKFRTHRATYGITATVWIVSILLAIPGMMYSVKRGIIPECKCEIYFPETKDYETLCIESGFVDSGIDQCVALLSADAEKDFCRSEDSFLYYYDYEGEVEGSSGNETAADSFNTTHRSEENTTSVELVYYATTTAIDTTDFPHQISSSAPASANNATAINDYYDTQSSQEDSYQIGCDYKGYNSLFLGFIVFNFAVMFLVPFIVIAICYLLIVKKVRKSRFKDFKEDKPQSAAQKAEEKTKKRVTIMCLTLVVIFAVCWLPYNAVHLAKMNGIHGSESFCRNIFFAASLMAYINSAINPYIYFVGASFKSKLKRARESQTGIAVANFLSRTRITSSGSSASASGIVSGNERVKLTSIGETRVKEVSNTV